MTETYNKNWADEIKSVDVKSDGNPDLKTDKGKKDKVKEDKVRSAAIKLLDEFKTRSLPPEQFNRLVAEVKDILRRKDFEEKNLADDYNNILGQEKNINEFNQKVSVSELTLKNINKTTQKKWIVDNIKDKVSESSKENIANIKSSLSKNYQEIKDFYLINGDKLTEKQKWEYEKLLSKCNFLLSYEIKDPSLIQTLENQASNIWKTISETFNITEAKANTNWEVFKKIINTSDYKWIEKIYKEWKQKDFEDFLLKNWKERRFFIKWIKEIKGGMCPIDNQKFYEFLWKLQRIELNEKKKEFEQKAIARLWEKHWKLLVEYIDKQLDNDPCSFSLIKVISDFNKTLDWTKTQKLSLQEINDFAKEGYNIKNDSVNFELTNYLRERGLDIWQIEWKNEQEIRKLLDSRHISIPDQKYILDLYSKYKQWNIVAKKMSYYTSADVWKIIDFKGKWLSNKDINSELEKWNPALKAFNQNNNIPSNYNFSSSIINVPSDNRTEFYGEIFKNLDSGKWKNENLSFPNWFNINISKSWNFYEIHYWDKKETCKDINEAINVISMWEYIQKVWLWFLFWGISRVIDRIKEKWNWKIDEKDGLSNDEMRLWLKSIWQALIPGFDSSNPDIKELEKQFTDKEIFNQKINDLRDKKNDNLPDKLKNHIWNISSLFELAKLMYPGDSKWKDFSIDSFINSI
ncbi:MAG: hypothetical protein ACD_49C00026G0028 [uncultured bacterium (gcode 4)]|uniref:Uncharacterized protein n=1 Tax=uncultured bacterium (gcode 4) TaxID=1234023 RepID=K2BD52_9BACT|nr:MAG: hypothetical protein ACD_49C00026G0028 [uncultured bacterium (gcode 4)]